MATVRQLLDDKGRQVWSIAPDDSVYDSIKLMADKEIGAVVVIENDRPVGIFTERDYARNVILKGKTSPETKVGDVMIRDIICAKPDQTVEECMAVMTSKRIRHLPVVEHNKLIGLVSIGDLVKSVIAEQQFAIEQLDNFHAERLQSGR